MKVNQWKYHLVQGWTQVGSFQIEKKAQLVFVFGSTSLLKTVPFLEKIKFLYPHSQIVGCSTAGEICGVEVLDDFIVVTAIYFQATPIHSAMVTINHPSESFSAARDLALHLKPENLSHVFVLSDGLNVNGSELVKGLVQNLPSNIKITGGLAGDGSRFKETLVFCNSAPQAHRIVIVGFYGEKIKMGCASMGGWDPFGPERLVTRSQGNILYELDGKPALALYKKYLGVEAANLPSSGLLFPLCVHNGEKSTAVVRTILAVDEISNSMTFAGDIPEGSYAFLMKANFDRLIDGSSIAAKNIFQEIHQQAPDLALLISCVGRKLILNQRVEEEVEVVREIFGETTPLAGFYSYGEISPFALHAKCELHNQTMTITSFLEK